MKPLSQEGPVTIGNLLTSVAGIEQKLMGGGRRRHEGEGIALAYYLQDSPILCDTDPGIKEE